MVRGIYHSHSEFSYDGVMSLQDISIWGKECRFDFIILTEHDDDFSSEKFARFCDECEKNSNEVILVPGIEYEFVVNGKVLHIGVIMMKEFFDLRSKPMRLPDFLETVREGGGFSVLHHPFRIMGELSGEVICQFDFIEAWNIVHDIRYAPNKKIIEIAEESGFRGMYLASRDVHYYKSKDRFPYITIRVDKHVVSGDLVVGLLKRGAYEIHTERWHIAPSGAFSSQNMWFKLLPTISLLHQLLYEKVRHIYNKSIKIPPPRWLVKIIK